MTGLSERNAGVGAIGAVGGNQGAGGDRGNLRQLFEEAKQLASSSPNIQQDLDAIHQAHAQVETRSAAGAPGGPQQGGTDRAELSPEAQGILATASAGGNTPQRAQMHETLAPYIQKLTEDVQAAQSQSTGGKQPQPGAVDVAGIQSQQEAAG